MNVKTLEILLNDPDASEFMWNGFDSAFVELNGTLSPFPSPFKSAMEFDSLISDLSKLNNTVSGYGLYFDGMLSDGSRFHNPSSALPKRTHIDYKKIFSPTPKPN